MVVTRMDTLRYGETLKFMYIKYQPILVLPQPRSQGLSSLPPLVVGTETLVAAGHVTQNLGGRKIC